MKKYMFILISLFAFFVSTNNAYAIITRDDTNTSVNKVEDRKIDDQLTCDSTGILGNPKEKGKPAYYMQKVFVVMKYAGIVLCIILTAVDFAQCILKDDKDGFKPALNKGLKRLIFAIVLFFLPTIVDTIMTLIGFYGTTTCGIG